MPLIVGELEVFDDCAVFVLNGTEVFRTTELFRFDSELIPTQNLRPIANLYHIVFLTKRNYDHIVVVSRLSEVQSFQKSLTQT